MVLYGRLYGNLYIWRSEDERELRFYINPYFKGLKLSLVGNYITRLQRLISLRVTRKLTCPGQSDLRVCCLQHIPVINFWKIPLYRIPFKMNCGEKEGRVYLTQIPTLDKR